jgi:hypothetical protein
VPVRVTDKQNRLTDSEIENISKRLTGSSHFGGQEEKGVEYEILDVSSWGGVNDTYLFPLLITNTSNK